MPAELVINLCVGVPYSNPSIVLVDGLPTVDAPEWFTWTDLGFNEYTIYISPNEDVGTHEIIVSEADKYITVVISNCDPDELVEICIGGAYNSGLLAVAEGFAAWTVYGTTPDWFTLNGEVAGEQTFSVIGTGPATTYVTLESVGEAESVYYVIKVVVSDCLDSFVSCLERYINIAWFLPTGYGWRSFLFGGIKTYGVEIESSNTFKDQDGVLKFSSVEDVRDSVNAASGQIRRSDLEYVKSLRYAIQAYIWDSDTFTFTPIVIDKGSFTLRKDDDNMFTYKFDFVYGEDIQVQHQ